MRENMLIRIDILYPHEMHSGKQFPAAPSTLFQAVTAVNGYRLDSVTDVLTSWERGEWLRTVQHTEAKPIHFTTTVPKYKAATAADRRNIDVYHSIDGRVLVFDKSTVKPEPLMKSQTMFMLESAPVHVSYYFRLDQEFSVERLNDVLRVNVLGRGESVTMSCVSIVDELPVFETGTIFEPASCGKPINIPCPGFLENLRLLYDNHQTALDASPNTIAFAIRDSVSPYASICYDLVDENNDRVSYPQDNMADISAMMRHAMMTALQGKVDAEYVSGHSDVHPFYLPVPSIGSEHADGDIRRVIVAEPASGPQLLSKKQTAVTSLKLVNDAGEFVCYALQRTDNDEMLDRYLSASKKFRTVTPMILDRDGGQKRVGKRISALIVKAGFPKPTRVTFNKTWWAGKLPVPVARCAVHVEVEFPVAVSGPLLAGVAEGFGIGLFYAN